MILFQKLRYQNLLSTGNQFTEILLDRSRSTLVVGENGAGKSTFIEALTFALYGKPFRNINKPQLINSITGKHMLTEIEFQIGRKKYLVRRGMKPTVFELYVNGKMLNQTAIGDQQEYLEKQILKMNFKSFTQIVVLGSANYVPFMQLKTSERRKVVEDLLDIQVFSVMNALLKERITANKTDVMELDHQIFQLQNKIDMHAKYVASLKQNNDDLIASKVTKIEEHQLAIDEYQQSISKLFVDVDDLQATIADQTALQTKRTNLVQMESALDERLRKIKREVDFFHQHDNCPTCKQGIDHEFKTTTIATRTAKVDEIDSALVKIESQVLSIVDRLGQIEEVQRNIMSINESINTNNSQIKFRQQHISSLNEEIAQLNHQGTKIKLDLDDSQSYDKDLKRLRKQAESLSRVRALHDVSTHLLKDSGIKTKIIRQYVPVMNKLINKYLASMDFFVNFELDENFNETIKSRFRDEFTYASFSEGEKMRIDLSLMFTWRAIAKLRNSASTNLLIMDEVFDSSLDGPGTDEFLKILEALTQDNNVFVISHKGDSLFDKFHSVIKFEKHANFSRIAA